MEPVLYILAFAGVSAVLLRLGQALFRLVFRSGEAWIAAEAANARQRSGDITGLSEAAEMERRARGARRGATLQVVFWVLLLLVPPFTSWALSLYSAYSILWLASGRVRGGAVVRTGPLEPR